MADRPPGSCRLAVLIDADNARPAMIESLLAEVATIGVAGVRRAYGDWTTPHLAGWRATLLDHSIQPVQQFRHTVGKNATDSAMIIDAMDLLHARRLDGFCLVSSDSDFTALARRIREDGLLVIGFGERKTPKPFVAACSRFVFTDLPGPEAPASEAAARTAPPEPVPMTGPGRTPSDTAVAAARDLTTDEALLGLVRRAVEAAADDTGWAFVSAVGESLARLAPGFDARRHGHGKLSDLLRALPPFEVKERQPGTGPAKALQVRVRPKAASKPGHGR